MKFVSFLVLLLLIVTRSNLITMTLFQQLLQAELKYHQSQKAAGEKKLSTKIPSKIGNCVTVGGTQSGVVLTCITDYKNTKVESLPAPKKTLKPEYQNSNRLKPKTSSGMSVSGGLKPKTAASTGLKLKTSGDKPVSIEGVSVKPLTNFTIPKVRSQSAGNRLDHFESLFSFTFI